MKLIENQEMLRKHFNILGFESRENSRAIEIIHNPDSVSGNLSCRGFYNPKLRVGIKP